MGIFSAANAAMNLARLLGGKAPPCRVTKIGLPCRRGHHLHGSLRLLLQERQEVSIGTQEAGR